MKIYLAGSIFTYGDYLRNKVLTEYNSCSNIIIGNGKFLGLNKASNG